MARKILLALVVLALAAVLLEVGARLWVTRVAGDEAFLRYASLDQLQGREGLVGQLSPHRYVGYVPTPGWEKGLNRHNALGFRGPEIEREKPPGEFRIACLGGSTTYTSSVENALGTYPACLELRLHELGHEHVRVINAGCPGWTSWESLIGFELRVLDLAPDLVIVYHGVNDVHPRLVWPPEAYKGDNSGYLRPVDPLFLAGVLEHSTLARIFLVRSGRIEPHASLDRTIKGYAATYHGDKFFRQRLDGTYPQYVFERTPAAEMLRVNRPVYFERNLTNLAAAARAHGCATVFATFANLDDFDEPRSSSPEYLAAYAETNALVLELGRRLDVPVFDFAAAFPRERRYFADGRHLTAEGALLKGRLFADFLVERGLVPPAAR